MGLPAGEITLRNKTSQFPEVRVVEASAGSGKTYALAKRYIQLLFHPSLREENLPIRSILAITFTNKAAFEMKGRILEFLTKMALRQLSADEEKDIECSLNVDAGQASQKAFAVMEDIIRHYNFFQVQTIDKFINALLSGCAFKIGLTANFKIKTNARDYLEHSLDQLIDQACLPGRQANGDLKIFESLIHQYLYLENRSGWFPREDILSILNTLFNQYNRYGCRFQGSSFKAVDLIQKKKEVLDLIKNLAGQLPEETHAGFRKSLEAFVAENKDSFDIDAVSNSFTRDEFPLRKGGTLPKETERLWVRIRRDLKQICEHEAYSLFDPYVRLFGRVEGGLGELSAKDDVLFLEELNRKAERLFDEGHVTVAELYYRLASRFRHYLIDEFQDTSRLQWCNLKKMAEEALSTGGSLFYVGDRKQAIYGFRGGEAGLFDDIKEEFSAFNVCVESLTKNWRSRKAIVDFNNAVFSLENLKRFIAIIELPLNKHNFKSPASVKESQGRFEVGKGKLNKEEQDAKKGKSACVGFGEEDIEELGRLFQSARQDSLEEKKGGYVSVEFIDGDHKEDRSDVIRERVVDLIGRLRRRFACADIAVLTRNNTQVEQMTGWLLEKGIPVESERTSDITQNALIQELMAFLHFLESPIDNLSFAGFILGDIFHRISGIEKERLHRFVFDLHGRLANEKDFYIYMRFREEFAASWQKFFEEFFKNVGLYPLYELIISIYHRFGILAHFPQSQGFLMHFLEMVKEQEEEHSDLGSFLEYFDHIPKEDLYVHASDSDAVKILTIHKSKGLEFPVVILPYLSMDIQIGTSAEDYQPSYVLERRDGFMELIRLKGKYYGFSEELYQIYAREYKKAFLSELNNIYVALTRAKEELYLFVPNKAGNRLNDARLLIPDGMREMGAPAAASYEREKPKDMTLSPLPVSLHHDWIDYLKEEFQDIGSVRNRQERLQGEVIHSMLSCIGNLSVDKDRKEALDRALTQAGVSFSFIKDFSPYMFILTRLLETGEIRPFFECGEARVFTEKEIVDTKGHLKRLDRLILKDNEAWIVDFKSSQELQGEQRQQVREYINIVQGIDPERRVRGYLVYLDTMGVEEVREGE